MGKVRVGFIGVGGVATTHLINIANNDHAEIVAICDISEEIVLKREQEYQVTGYTDYHEMLEKETLDAVFICVPPFAHSDIEQSVVEKGIHLLVEKPVELNHQHAINKAELIRKSGVINASGYCLRYLDTVEIARSYLADKEVAMVHGYYNSHFVETPWYRMKNKSGGQLVEQATHILDLMIYLAGDIEYVNGMMALKVMKDIENLDIPDVTSVNTRFKSGAVGHLDCTIIQPDHRFGLEILGRDFRVELRGTTLNIIEKNNTQTFESKVVFNEEQDRAFIEAIRTGNQNLVLASYEDGLNTLITSLAANYSNEINQTMLVSEFRES